MKSSLASRPDDRLVRTCSIWRALEAIGDTASLLILEANWLGIRVFGAICIHTGLQKALVSDRLKRLIDFDIIYKKQYNAHPPRFEYILTPKGRSLFDVALMMLRWERRWGDKTHKISVQLIHKSCGKAFSPVPSCGHCLTEYSASEIRISEGPGVGWMRPLNSRRRQRRDQLRHDKTVLFDTVASITGDRWSSLVLRSIYMGYDRFEPIRQECQIASNILSDRLDWLVEIGVLERRKCKDSGRRERYCLTESGRDYLTVLLPLMVWGDRWYAALEGPPLLLSHPHCGKPLEPVVTCSACGQQLEPEQVDFTINLPSQPLLS